MTSRTTDPAHGAAPDSGAAPHQKQQGADRPLEDPTDASATHAVRASKADDEKAMAPSSSGTDAAASHDPGAAAAADDDDDDDVKDPPPRDPNDHSGEPMHDHGADETQGKEGTEEGKAEGTSKGTGMQWVKSTGTEAEGGDFDATKPGAAKEADRLMEQKGMHHSANDGEGDSKADPFDPTNRPGMGTKIKDALHMGHKS